MYKLFTDKAELFECDIKIEGASLSNSTARLVVETNDYSLMFNGSIDSLGKCKIPIKKLTPQAFQIWKAASPVTAGTGKQEINTPEDVQKAIFANLELMIQRGFATGAPGRRHMPQSDSGGNPIDRLGDLAKGKIKTQMNNVMNEFVDYKIFYGASSIGSALLNA